LITPTSALILPPPTSLEDINRWVKWWTEQIGTNAIPADTKNKKTWIEWSQWQNQPIPDEQYQKWFNEGAFDKGVAIILGKVWRGSHKGKYLNFIDCDNKIAIKEFCTRDGIEQSFKDNIVRKFLIEQRKNGQDRCHIFFYSEIQIASKPSDKTSPDFNPNDQPSYEVKGSSKGIAYVTPSIHQSGERYEIIGTTEPVTLSRLQSHQMMHHIEDICKRYGLEYLKNIKNNKKGSNSSSSSSLIPTSELFLPETVFYEGQNRHLQHLRACESVLRKNWYGLYQEDQDQLRKICDDWNQEHCNPPLPQTDIDRQWGQAINKVKEWVAADEKKEAERKQKKREQQQKQEQELQESDILGKDEETARETKTRILAEALERKCHFAAMEDTGELFYYNDSKGLYEPAEGLVKKKLEEMFPGIITDTVTNITEKLARRHSHKREEFDNDVLIFNLANGLYDLRTGTLREHSWQYLSRKQFPITFDPKAKSKKFGKFLSEVNYPNQIRTTFEAMAYTFLRDNPFELYFILLGFGSNGKSVLMHVLTRLHGEDNVAHTSLVHLLGNKFAKMELEGKNVNIDMEMSKATIEDMAVLKELTGSEPIRVEQKYRDAYFIEVWAKHFFSANEMPPIKDNTDAHFRREVVISFPNQFVEGVNANPNLKHELTTQEELSGIFNALLIPLRKIALENKAPYVDVKTISQRRLKHQLVSDPVKAFLEIAVESTDDGGFIVDDPDITKEDLYQGYKQFCAFYKMPWDKYDSFCKEVKKKGNYLDGRQSSGDRKTVWKGIRLKKSMFEDPLTV
jgi:P4 family phage/plasmid primase-like protien